MKKITLLVAALAVTAFTTAQTVLSHSTDNTLFETGSVACASDPDQVPQTGDEGSSDNIFYRSYVPANFGISGDFEVQGANFFISFQDVGGTDPTSFFTVRFYVSDGVFPNGTLIEIASQDLSATVADHGTLFEVTLDTPVSVSADAEIVIGVDFPEALPVPDNYDIRIGINGAGQDAPSYLTSDACGIAIPTPAADVGPGFPNNNIILDLVGMEVLGVNEELLSQVSVYPNPATDVINLNVPSSVELQNVSIFDVLGKEVKRASASQVSIADLSAGVYILKAETSAGELTEKIVKN
ncbi:T9SS type A sorting domain-containing protein [Marixanthomonas ophiurae]|uniref:T9SS C-terminal target domain-containing protein n=1 Tax=Marixanthomonas ophiurae TaxID=387659 RepID=A0A3E1QCT5_9FLAO|nr:T9SS type A sorting domain-containing protein [Marixanthomonas ophiurae]RFN59922.1 T9SS C-terminal target domain-containing protein [Marixanthomonas ophiurae]